jgi:hypothetical protein
MKYISFLDLYGTPITVFHRSQEAFSSKFGIFLSFITICLLAFHIYLEFPDVIGKKSPSVFSHKLNTYQSTNAKANKQAFPLYFYMNDKETGQSYTEYFKFQIIFEVRNATKDVRHEFSLEPCKEKDLLYFQSLASDTIPQDPLCVEDFEDLAKDFVDFNINIAALINYCTIRDSDICKYDEKFIDRFDKGEIPIDFGMAFYDTGFDIFNSEQINSKQYVMPGSTNAKDRRRYDVLLNYLEIVYKNTDYFSKEERHTSYSIYEAKPVDPINEIYYINLTDMTERVNKVSFFFIEHKKLFPAISNLISFMVIYVVLFNFLSFKYNQLQINTKIINKNFEWYAREDEMIERRKPSMSTENNPFSTEREINAKIRPVRDFETLQQKHEALKKERKKLNYNIFKRTLFCCKRLLGKAGNRHDIMYNKAITLVKKNLSIENLMKLTLKFQQLKEYCLNNVENTLFDNRNRIIVYYNLVEDSSFRDNFFEHYTKNPMQEFYNVMYANNLENERMFKYLSNDLKYIYRTFK